MSRGTTFKLLKKSRVEIEVGFSKTLIEKYEKSNTQNEQFFTREPGDFTPKHPKFINSESDVFDLLDTEHAIPYNVALECTFNSIFDEVREMLIDRYGMNSYDPWKSQFVMSREMAKDMLIAANYVLLEHYDSQIEQILDNPFINAIGTMSEKFTDYQYRQKFPNDTEYVHEEDNSYTIKCLTTILSAFINADESEDYVLVIKVWG